MTDLHDIRENYSMGMEHRREEFDEFMARRDLELKAEGHRVGWGRAVNVHPSWWTDAEYSRNPYEVTP